MKNFFALVSGLLFGAGLAVSGMTNTEKVLGFLDISGDWVPDLAFVMGGAVLTTTLGYFLLFKFAKRPLFNVDFSLPLSKAIDAPLILGAGIFGVGWGLYGYCPGPALASVIYFSSTTYIFIAALVLGMMLTHLLQKRIKF